MIRCAPSARDWLPDLGQARLVLADQVREERFQIGREIRLLGGIEAGDITLQLAQTRATEAIQIGLQRVLNEPDEADLAAVVLHALKDLLQGQIAGQLRLVRRVFQIAPELVEQDDDARKGPVRPAIDLAQRIDQLLRRLLPGDRNRRTVRVGVDGIDRAIQRFVLIAQTRADGLGVQPWQMPREGLGAEGEIALHELLGGLEARRQRANRARVHAIALQLRKDRLTQRIAQMEAGHAIETEHQHRLAKPREPRLDRLPDGRVRLGDPCHDVRRDRPLWSAQQDRAGRREMRLARAISGDHEQIGVALRASQTGQDRIEQIGDKARAILESIVAVNPLLIRLARAVITRSMKDERPRD